MKPCSSDGNSAFVGIAAPGTPGEVGARAAQSTARAQGRKIIFCKKILARDLENYENETQEDKFA